DPKRVRRGARRRAVVYVFRHGRRRRDIRRAGYGRVSDRAVDGDAPRERLTVRLSLRSLVWLLAGFSVLQPFDSAPGTPSRAGRLAHAQPAAPKYDLLLRGGHVIDARNSLSAPRDVAIAAGRIAAVAAAIPPADAAKTIDVSGLYVVPGLVDIHTHVYAGTGEKGSYAGDNSVYPDGFTFRSGVTTIADAGSSGWRNFEDFKQRIIDRSGTRVLAFLNIVGQGMRGGAF